MSEASTCSAGGNTELGASLLITGGNRDYSKIWRKSLYIGFLISLKKPPTTASEINSSESESPLSSAPYSSLPPARTSSSKSSVAIDICSHHTQQHIRNHIPRIVKEKDLKSLLELGGVDHILHVQSQNSDSEKTAIDNRNLGTSFSGLLWNSCKHNRYTVSMLLISAFLSFATGFKQEGPRYGWHDGVATVFAVLVLLSFSSITNFWHQRKMMKLAKRIDKVKFKVERGEKQSKLVDLAISDIVVGDKVLLKPHDEVPANGLLVSGDNIVLLAEGMKIEKIDHESNPFLIAGSKVIQGHGRMLVVASDGNKSNLAEMKSSMSYKKRGLLESLIEKPVSYIDKVSLSIFTLVALVVLIRVICKKDGDGGGLPETKGNVSVGFMMQLFQKFFMKPPVRISIFTSLLTVAILSVQHGVPLMVNISLKYQFEKVVQDQGAVLNDLSACTTMGLVTVICIDVSGELISKPMEVGRIWMGEGEIDDLGKFDQGSETGPVVLDKLKQGVGLSVLAPQLPFSPISNSLVSWAETALKMETESLRQNFVILEHRKLNSDQEGSGVLVRKVSANEQVLHLHWSGDASTILKMCSQYYDSEGECHAIENQKIKFGQVIKEMEDNGFIPIAFAYRQTEVQELEQDELTLLALIGLKYKSTESIKLALENLPNVGIRIKLVSEDDIMLVKDIAHELGIEVPVNGHLEGKELQDLNDTARLVKVDQAIVMGSFSSEDKLLMVKCLQGKGDVVAFIEHRLMTNRTSEALKVADVGIIHNSLRRVMNRESSSISITCFSALKPIVRAGRSKYHNIRKFIQLHLTVSISGLLITLITTMSTGKTPLKAIQLIWVNVLMCLLGGLMMAMELSSEQELPNKPSDNRNQPIITKNTWGNIVIQVLYQASACMILEFGGHVTDSEKQVRKTMIFNTFFLCQLFNLLNTIDLLKGGVFKIDVKNNLFSVALGGCFVMQVVVIEHAKGLADCMHLNAARWALCVLVGAVPWLFEWILKKVLPIVYASPLASSPEAIPHPWFYLYWSFPFIKLLLLPLRLTGMTFH